MFVQKCAPYRSFLPHNFLHFPMPSAFSENRCDRRFRPLGSYTRIYGYLLNLTTCLRLQKRFTTCLRLQKRLSKQFCPLLQSGLHFLDQSKSFKSCSEACSEDNRHCFTTGVTLPRVIRNNSPSCRLDLGRISS